ncbi:hypothetical protein HPB47_017918 [Ixodes persulcatus]|uniref:Uncharacterized protein n=1 Tax=Ixodes persulcatus TaxID=34615 RepID=A0AC60QM34_IXOPE|nr:hypothetical protein HPB47_017918 [Ixodes persulcatus]
MPHPSQESVDRLKRKRTTLRAATTKVINEIGALLTSDPTEIEEIEPSVEDEALVEEVSGAEGYAERISVAKTRVKRKIKEHETEEQYSGLQLTIENYQVALDRLTQRFRQKDLIVEDHMSRLLAVRAVHDSRNVERLRTLYDQIETGVRSLEALGVEEKTYGVLLLTVVRKAIPADIGLEYSRKVNAQSVNRENELRGFLSFFKGEVECRERIQPVTEGTVRRRSDSDSAEGPRVASAAALTTTTEADNRCVFCRTDDHGPDSCVSGLSLEDRKAVLQRENRCFRCTKRGHLSRVCRGAKWLRCAWCGGRHVTAMCNPNGRSDHSGEGGGGRRGFAVITRNLRNDRTKQEPGATADSTCVGRRLLLDGGSQRTFVRRDISERLHLRMLGEEDRQDFHLRRKRNDKSNEVPPEVRVEALEVPCICADLVMAPSEVVVTQMKMEGMNIADVTPDNAVKDGIGLLIGADHYWDVVTGSVRRLRPKLMAVDTVFGWTLQGLFGTTKSKAICSTATNVMRATVRGGDGVVYQGRMPESLYDGPVGRRRRRRGALRRPRQEVHRKSTQRLPSTLTQTVGYRVFDHDEVNEVNIIIKKRLEEETVDNDHTFSRRLDGAHKKRFAEKQTPSLRTRKRLRAQERRGLCGD